MNGPVGATLASPSQRRGKHRAKGSASAGVPKSVQTGDPGAANASATTTRDSRHLGGRVDATCYVDVMPCAALCDCVLSSSLTMNPGHPREQRKGGKSRGGRGKQLQRTFCTLPYARGIVNNSNFCFVNSVMQALAFIPSLAQLAVCVASDPDAAPQLPNVTVLGRWLLDYWKPAPPRQCVRPPRFLFSMDARRSTGGAGSTPQRAVDGSLQEDAQEFLQVLLETMQLELTAFEASLKTADSDLTSVDSVPTQGSSGGEKGWLTVKGKEKVTVRAHVDSDGRSQLLDALFGGTLESRLQGKAKQKNHASAVLEHYYTLPVDIGFATECTVEEALTRSFATEKIYDEKRDKQLKKALFLDTLPQVLILHLRRWAMTAEGELVKLDNRVTFGATLTLPAAVCSDNKRSVTDRTYSLLSVVAHRGGGTRQGHYVTFLAQHVAAPSEKTGLATSGPDNGRKPPTTAQVVLCNDTKLSTESFQVLAKETVYFLVYQKK